MEYFESKCEKIEPYWLDKWRIKGTELVTYVPPRMNAALAIIIAHTIIPNICANNGH